MNDKITVHDHMTHVVRDSLTGHEQIGKLHFDLKIMSLHIYRKTMHFLKASTANYESKVYLLSNEILF